MKHKAFDTNFARKSIKHMLVMRFFTIFAEYLSKAVVKGYKLILF